MIYKNPWLIKKEVLPQHTDHAGVLWHGSYINWLEEARFDALSKTGFDYKNLINDGYELPVKEIKIKYIRPIYIGEEITIKSYFDMKIKSPKILVKSELINKNNFLSTIAEVVLVLINKKEFKIVKNKPKYINDLYVKLFTGPNNN